MNTTPSKMGIGTRDVYRSSQDYRNISSLSMVWQGLSGGPAGGTVQTNVAFRLKTDVLLIGIQLSAIFTFTSLPFVGWAGLARGKEPNTIFNLANHPGVLIAVNHVLAVGGIAGIPSSKIASVTFDEPYYPIIPANEPIGAFATNNLAIPGDNLACTAVIYYVPITSREH